jgi:hypothetical protein
MIGRIVLCLMFVFSCAALATEPLSLLDFQDCIGYNSGHYDADCVLQSGQYSISSTLWIRRSNVTVDGAWPYPVLRRVPGFTGDLMRTADNTEWVVVRSIYFDGNRWNGATSASHELNLAGCSYCRVTQYALFTGSPSYALGIDRSKPQAVEYAQFGDSAYGFIYAGSQPECSNPSLWYPNVCLSVVGAWFLGSGTNAIGFDPRNALITGNHFSFNHRDCGYGAPGGQIDLDAGADRVTVSGNTFEYGPTCSNGWWAVGVELHGTNLTLIDNTIRYNAGEGIYMEGAQHVTITSTDPATYPISHNNQKGWGFTGCGGFPGIRVHSSYAAGRQTRDITIQNLWSISGHNFGVEVSTCATTGWPVDYITILNNCVAGNAGGVYAPAAGYPRAIYNNLTSGCGGY